MRQNRLSGIRAFTLVELLIVIIIIAVLAAIAIPKFADSSKRSKEAALRADLKLYRNAIELFKADTGAYPALLSDLAATTAPAAGVDSTGTAKTITQADWKGPYLQAIETDPMSGSGFTYSILTPNVGVVKSSAGSPYDTW
jgi:general secretion pathway protein G